MHNKKICIPNFSNNYGINEEPRLIGFLDTGQGGDYSNSPAVIMNPVDDPTLFSNYVNGFDVGNNYVDINFLHQSGLPCIIFYTLDRLSNRDCFEPENSSYASVTSDNHPPTHTHLSAPPCCKHLL